MKAKKILLCFLCLVLFFGMSLSPTVLAVEGGSTEYDYSNPGSYFNEIFTSSDLLSYIGESLTDGERAYLDAFGSINLKYEAVTTQHISVVSRDDVTEVVARPYSYTTGKGSVATWTPTSVSVDGVAGELVLKDGAYVATFESSLIDEESTLSVNYTLDVTFLVCASDVNELLNLAYDNAPAIKSSVELARAEYEEKREEYVRYYALNSSSVDKYRADCILYSQYLLEKLIYDEKSEEYLAYLGEYALYEERLELYNEYLADLDEYNDIIDNNLHYEDNLEKYYSDRQRYEKYLFDLSVADTQLKALNDGLMTKVTYLKRQLYSALFSSLVDKVVTNRELFVTVLGVDGKIIDDCAKASDNIKEILAPKRGVAYKDLKTNEEKYDFYVNNHAELRDAVVTLTRSLLELYSYDVIRNTMHNPPTLPGQNPSPDYTEKFSIFISQLILFSNAISDKPVMDYTGSFVLDENVKLTYWTEDGTEMRDKKVIDILEGNVFVTDSGNASPISGGYPDTVVEPIKPELLPVPDIPTPVQAPTKPTEVTDPGEPPTVVYEPTPPEGYIPVPERPEILDNEVYSLLIADYDAGLLTERAEITEDILYTPSVTLEKSMGGTDTVTVVFADSYGDPILEVSVDKGSSASFIGALPTKDDDISATYVFECWADLDGNRFDLSSVNENVILYPYFKPSYKEYEVEYNVDGTGKNRIYVSVPDETVEHIPLSHFIEIAESTSAGLFVKAENLTLEMRYGTLMELASLGVSCLNVNIDPLPSFYTFEINAMNDRGEVVDTTGTLSVSIPCDDSSFATNALLTYAHDGEIEYVNKSYSNGEVRFNLVPGISYTLAVRYSVNVPSSIKDKVSAPSDAIPGQTVTLSVDLPLGQEVELYYLLSSDSNTKYPIEGFSFVMPSESVNLRAKFTDILYTVTFISDGKEISSRTYKYGEEVRVPAAPSKLSDGEYSYTFTGWSAEVSAVTADVTYVAVFDRTPLPKVEKSFPWFSVIYYSAIALFSLGVVAVVLLILKKKGVIKLGNRAKKSRDEDRSMPENEEKQDEHEVTRASDDMKTSDESDK